MFFHLQRRDARPNTPQADRQLQIFVVLVSAAQPPAKISVITNIIVIVIVIVIAQPPAKISVKTNIIVMSSRVLQVLQHLVQKSWEGFSLDTAFNSAFTLI